MSYIDEHGVCVLEKVQHLLRRRTDILQWPLQCTICNHQIAANSDGVEVVERDHEQLLRAHNADQLVLVRHHHQIVELQVINNQIEIGTSQHITWDVQPALDMLSWLRRIIDALASLSNMPYSTSGWYLHMECHVKIRLCCDDFLTKMISCCVDRQHEHVLRRKHLAHQCLVEHDVADVRDHCTTGEFVNNSIGIRLLRWKSQNAS